MVNITILNQHNVTLDLKVKLMMFNQHIRSTISLILQKKKSKLKRNEAKKHTIAAKLKR